MAHSDVLWLSVMDSRVLDHHAYLAVFGVHVIRPGRQHATEVLRGQAVLQLTHRVQDIGCGVGTTEITSAHTIAQRLSAEATAADNAPLMPSRAQANVRDVHAAGVVAQVCAEGRRHRPPIASVRYCWRCWRTRPLS